jgi:ABC-2 type transport system ATP-binding protein
MQALEVRHLCKSFGTLKAVDDVSFSVSQGAVFGLIGRNGAGKTTTIRMMMNVFGPDSGEILYHGNKTGEEFRRKVSYLPEERGLYKKMKVIDLLNFFLEIRGIDPAKVKTRTHEYLERFSLDDRIHTRIEDLSKGNQQKVQFIAAILSDPEVLVLDEPFSGLDPVNTGLLKDIVMELKQKGKVIIFSTHLMELAERMCDQIALIHQGKLMLNGSLSDIKQQYSQRNITLVHEGNLAFLTGHPLVESVNDYGNFTGIRVKHANDVQTLLQLLVFHKIVIKKFDANDISLQEIFLEVAGDNAVAVAAPLFESNDSALPKMTDISE